MFHYLICIFCKCHAHNLCIVFGKTCLIASLMEPSSFITTTARFFCELIPRQFLTSTYMMDMMIFARKNNQKMVVLVFFFFCKWHRKQSHLQKVGNQICQFHLPRIDASTYHPQKQCIQRMILDHCMLCLLDNLVQPSHLLVFFR